MKTNTIKTIVTGIVAGMLLFTSCGKDGPVGPQGPAGKNGAANITVQDFTVTTWSSIPNFDYYADLTIPALTQAVQDNGTVQVFMSWNSGTPIWTALPYTFNNTPVYIMNYNTQTGFVVLQWVYNNSGGPLANDPNTEFGVTSLQFKVVIIPPAARLAHPNVNFHNFNEIKEAFKLK
jgi:hypothetical protein